MHLKNEEERLCSLGEGAFALEVWGARGGSRQRLWHWSDAGVGEMAPPLAAAPYPRIRALVLRSILEDTGGCGEVHLGPGSTGSLMFAGGGSQHRHSQEKEQSKTWA